MTRPSCLICRERAATTGVLCEKCAAELDGSLAIAPQQLQLRTHATANAALIDVWGQALQLDPRTPVGRADISHGLVIVQPSVSRAHAVIEQRDQWYVRDAGSSSGTFVNDRPVREQALASGDRVRFGDIEFFFVIAETPLPPRPERFDAATLRAPAKSTEPPVAAPAKQMTIELQTPGGGGGGVVIVEGRAAQLTTPQYELMALLVERMRADAGKPADERGFVAMTELMKLSLDVSDPGDDHVRQLVRRVRRALVKAEIGDLIEARRGVGYRLRVVPKG